MRLFVRIKASCSLLPTHAGNIAQAIEIFHSLATKHSLKPDRGAYNVIINYIMDLWCEEGRIPQSENLLEAYSIFHKGWKEGVFIGPGEASHRRVSRRGFMVHADLHRTGLWTCQFAVLEHLRELYHTFKQDRRVVALKFISGKGRDYKSQEDSVSDRMTLVDVVRDFLGRARVKYFEDTVGVFSIPKAELQRTFKKWTKEGFECTPTSWSRAFVDPRI